MTARRPHGTGSVTQRGDSWYGRWRVNGRQVQRKLGPVRPAGTRLGLTKSQAEAKLRKLIGEVSHVAPDHRVTFAEIADTYLHHVEFVMERKRSTVQDYKIMLDRHLGPHFAEKPIDRLTADDIGAYMAAKAREGLATKTIANHLNFAHGVFAYAVKRGMIAANPVASVDRPRASGADPDIRYLDRTEVEALLRAVPDDLLGPTDRAVYLTATMTGLRQGEIVALRWRDVDWTAGLVRVRRNYTRGQWGTPKSRRSSRAVPMADRLAAELERHYQRSAYQADDDLVFAHPQTGNPYDASKMRERFKAALVRAKVREVRFHDLRHTYGTAMAAAGAPLRTLQGWMGHKSYTTTEVYADFAPDPTQGATLAEAAFGELGHNLGHNLSETESNSAQPRPTNTGHHTPPPPHRAGS
jgi:integrase